MKKESTDFQCRRAAKERKVLEAKLRLGARPDYPDTPEQIAEKEDAVVADEVVRLNLTLSDHYPVETNLRGVKVG